MAAPIEANEFLLRPDDLTCQQSQNVFSHFAATRGSTDCNLTADHPGRLRCAQVDYNFLAMLGVRPLPGRDLAESDDADTALVSHRLWQSHFGGNPALLNATVETNR